MSEVRIMREIRVFSSMGATKTISSAATNLLELQKDLSEYGVSYSNMNHMVGETKSLLLADDSSLPEGAFTLFLTPIKTKSGMDVDNMAYKELRATIKGIIDVSTDLAKEHFNCDNKNYTTKSTETLRELLKTWFSKSKVNYVADKPNAYIPEVEVPVKEKISTKVKKQEVESVQPDGFTALSARIESLEKRVAVLESKDCEPQIVEVVKQPQTKFDDNQNWQEKARRDAEELARKIK